uniref:Uncharacterized protein n=1 Tax=Glossina austeni TaxID=7395 RepID=A0A1A9VN58_GLOAU
MLYYSPIEKNRKYYRRKRSGNPVISCHSESSYLFAYPRDGVVQVVKEINRLKHAAIAFSESFEKLMIQYCPSGISLSLHTHVLNAMPQQSSSSSLSSSSASSLLCFALLLLIDLVAIYYI